MVDAFRLGFGVRDMMVVISGEVALAGPLVEMAEVDRDRGLALRVGVVNG